MIFGQMNEPPGSQSDSQNHPCDAALDHRRASVRLEPANIHRKVVKPHTPQVLVPRDLRKDRALDRHSTRPVSSGKLLLAGDDPFDAGLRKDAAIACGNP
jgi:hypothetical protein